MEEPEYGVCLHPTEDPIRQAELCKLAEDCNFGLVGMGDSQLLWDDVYMDLALAAKETKRIRLGPWVSNLITRHPTVTGRAMLTLARIAGNRLFLGLGTGDSSVRSMGQKPARLQDCAKDIELIRRFWSGQEKFAGTEYRVEPKASVSIPIYWAARGMASMEFGGKHCDGVIIGGWTGSEVLRPSIECIRKGAQQAHRTLEGVKVLLHTALSIKEDRLRAQNEVKSIVARFVRDSPKEFRLAYSEELNESMEKIERAYVYAHHLMTSHDEVTRFVTEEMVNLFAIAGRPDECREKVREILDHGVDAICFLPAVQREEMIRALHAVLKEVR